MKHPILFLFLLTLSVNAQWTDNGNNITTTNNVGIGTTSPSGKLEILKDADLSNAITLPNSGLVLRADNDGNDASLRLGVDNSNLKALIQTQQTTTAAKFDLLLNPFGGNIGIGTTNPIRKLQIDAAYSTAQIQLNRTGSNLGKVDFGVDAAGLHFWVGGYDTFGNEEFFIGMNGGVGIGTTTPTEKLDVDGNIKILSAHDRGIIFERYGDKLPSSIKGLPGEYSTRQGISFNTSSIDKAVNILWNGDVGVGTDSPDAKLAVNGNIHTKEVKVDLVGWPDYVFKKNYILPTLEQVENHIREKGHLKDIPSAKEVQENGVYLGQMDAKLLQKIEELILYTIEQEKKIKLMESRLKKLERNNNKL